MENDNKELQQLQQAYQQLAQQSQQLYAELQAVRGDKLNERLKVLFDIVKEGDSDLAKLAKWHMKEILAKPKK